MTNIRHFALGLLVLTTFAHAELPSPTPIPKDGSCPSGYSSQGNFCTPSSGARFAIAKQGSCPSGYGSQGNYCVADSNARYAIPKGSGNCPSGYGSQGNYCVSGNQGAIHKILSAPVAINAQFSPFSQSTKKPRCDLPRTYRNHQITFL